MDKLLLVGLGGFVGASLRYIIVNISIRFFGQNLPIGTLLVNIIGCFFIGIIMELLNISENAKLFIVTGILGGLTTFSAFAYETTVMITTGKIFYAGINIFLNVFLGLLSLWIGRLIFFRG